MIGFKKKEGCISGTKVLEGVGVRRFGQLTSDVFTGK
jgi:hypothetical protein